MTFERSKIEKERTPNITVEIGVGNLPTMALATKMAEILEKDPNGKYIGIDIDSDALKAAREWTEIAEHLVRIKEKTAFVVASGEKLPLPDETVYEVVMRNVLSDPSVLDNVKLGMIKDVFRVLKNGGCFKIIETYDPEAAKKWKNDILGIKNNKFELAKELYKPMIFSTASSYELEEDQNASEILKKSLNDNSFIWEFKKSE